MRCVHEAQLHPTSCFVTLTYRDEDLPEDGSVDVRYWQLFAKRLRKVAGPFRYLHCGEYGSETGRPHYHAVLFGLDFASDRQVLRRRRKYTEWTSPLLERTWGLGNVSIGSLTFESAAYVARYCLKKARARWSSGRYERVDVNTGECWAVKPPYMTSSRNPGLGAKWFERFGRDVFPADEVVFRGRRYKPPRFYDKKFSELCSEEMERIKSARVRRAEERASDSTRERLAVREELAERRLAHFSDSVER